jgi:hypothetical protein
MTTFTSDDREEAYKKIVEAAPNQPGYEDAVPIPPTNQTSKELMEAGGMIGVLREQICQLQAENDELKATVRSLFEDFLNVREESDSGRVFAPVTLSSCRVMMTEPLSNLLNKMRKLSGAKPAPKSEASK